MIGGITEQLAVFVHDTTFASLPSEAVEATRRAVLDGTGCMLAGSHEPAARIAAEFVRSQAASPITTLVGQGARSSAQLAAFANGIAGHVLDYDDFNGPMHGHPTVSLLPAVLAVGEETGAAGHELVMAFVVGFEVEIRLGRGLGDSHYAKGWHATSTIGTMGAAAAAAKLYRLDVRQTRIALGMAASMAGGMRQNFGTMTKSLHSGHAAQSGVAAGRLARLGYTADADIVEGPTGFLELFSPEQDAHSEPVLAGLGESLEIMISGIGVKKYPCCYATHRALDAVLSLVAEYGIRPEEVSRVEVRAPRGASAPLIHPRPSNGLEGKFSMEYCVAAALIDRRVTVASFADGVVLRPNAQALLRRVDLSEGTGESPPAEGYADVRIVLSDGTDFRRRVDEPKGSPNSPLSWNELAVKFRDCAKRAIGGEATERALEVIGKLEEVPSAGTLTDLLAGQPATVNA